MKSKQKLGEYIPCLYLPYVSGSSKILIYFHGNAEDIGLATELLNFLKDMMKVRITFSLSGLGSRAGDGIPGVRRLYGGPVTQADFTGRSEPV